jgi:uncharacterized membrane protein YeaQ/YmgE (transglycosylase-associated protein family)
MSGFMNILGWIVLGGIAGWLASIIMKKNSQMGIFANICIGILGAFIGGFLMYALGGPGVTGFNIWSLVVATFGAVILLWLFSLFKKTKST